MKLPFEVPPTWCLDDYVSDAVWRDGNPKWGSGGVENYLPVWNWFSTSGGTVDGHGCGPSWDIGGAGYGHIGGQGSSPNAGEKQ